MGLPNLIHVCAVFVIVINCSDSCSETYAGTGDENVQLVFKFDWTKYIEKKTINCDKGSEHIGTCYILLGAIICGVAESGKGVYTCSSNEEFTAIYITILSFNERTAGEYTCSLEDTSQRTSICLNTSANLTSLTILPQNNVTYPVYKEESLFKCITSPSRPSASIYWSVAGRNITDKASYTYSFGEATSHLRYTPQEITSEELTCTAYYLFKSTNITMQRRTYMIIQFPVTRPIISINNSNISETALIRDGRSAEFKCSAISYPLPSYRWLYPGGTSEGATVTIQFNHTVNGGTMSCNATNNYLNIDGTAGTKSTTYKSSINLNITYPPLFVRIKNFENNISLADKIIRLVKGDALRLICESVANPPATTLWQGQEGHSNILTAINIQEDTQWTCEAFNTIDGVPERKNRTVYFKVLYGPVHLNLTYNILPDLSKTGTLTNNGIMTVIEGSTVQLKCSDSSLPTSKYSWDDGLEGNILKISNISRTTKTSYMCIAKNIMDTTFNGNVTERNNISLQLHVLYGPRDMSAVFNNNTLVFNRVLRVIEGWSFGLSCFANSQPASNISWKGITTHAGGNNIFIKDVDIGINKIIMCTGTNTMVDSLGNRISKSENLQIELDVLYPPVVQPIENQSVVINMSLNVVCKLARIGNPSDANFTWNKLESIHTFLNTGDTLKIDRAQLSDEGDFQCLATNTMHTIENKTVQGSSKSQFYLDIQYGARVKQFYANTSKNKTIIINQNQSIELICEVDGDPYPSINIINATGEQQLDLNGSTASYKNVTAHLHRARCEYDAGRYKCATNNLHTSTLQEESLSILIKCSPIASPFAPPLTTRHSAPNDTAVLTFTIKAFPKPSATNFTWFKSVSGGWDMLSNDNYYKISVSEDGLETNLTINHVNQEDFGTYRVNVSNTIGSTSEVFTLQAKAKPENPQEVNVVRTGITEIELEWKPGFNGGEQQTFIINYTDTNLESWNAIRVPANRTTHTLLGLKPDTTYKVKMRAENIIGNSTWTDYIQISTLAEIEQKGSVSKAVGGTIGGMSVILIIVAGIIRWRRRNTGRKDPISQHMLPKRSSTKKPEKTTYENIGMLTPSSNNYNMTSSSTKDRKQPTKHIQAANTVVKNNQLSHTVALKHTDRMDFTQSPDPHRKAFVGDIRRSGKADGVAIVQPHGQTSCALEQDPIYDNIVKKQKQFKSREIDIHNLQEAVVKAKADSTEVFTEFSALHVASESISYSTDTAVKSANTSKNRYKNMYPYDKNRVKLPVVGNDIDTDFINASFIDGYSSTKKYIAAQGPLASTRADFWSMIWEQNVGVIAMVTNLVEDSKRKCFQYWPTSPENDCQYSDYTIRLLSEETYANFVVRTLHCTKKGSIKVQIVNHLHFTAWPDKDVPDTALSLMQFWRKVRNVEKPDGAPWIVHCSAGVGRTGTFIAVDYLYDQGISEKQINVFDAVLLLRQQRINMVQTKNQYLYLHEVLCEALCTVGKVLTNTAFMDNQRTSESLNQEYQHICESHIPDREEAGENGEYTLVLDGEKPDNLNKNADQCVVPDERYRPVLNMTFTTLGHNDYINAVYISTFGEKDRLILTQSARVSSEIDFVRLLHDHSLRTVVTFADEVEPYMPGSSDSCLIGPFTATTKSETQKQVYQESVVQFKYIAEYEGFDVRIIRFTKWSNTLDVCNIKDLLSLLISVQESACKRPVVLQCRDGYSQSGLFAVLWCLVERCKRDGEVAVAETVRMIRRRRNQVITNETQYRFCHQFMKEYIEGCQVYANT